MVTSKRRMGAGEKVRKGFLYGFLLLLTSVAVLNAQPYLQASSNLFSEVVIIPGVDLLGRIPGVAPILALLGVLIPPLLGSIVWALLQTAEGIPIFLGDPEVLLRRIHAAKNWCQVNLGTSDVDWVNNLIERFISFPKDLQRDILKAAAVAYLIDGIIGVWYHPPLTVPVSSFGQAWGYVQELLVGDFDFGLVDWESVGKLMVMLFAFEGLIALGLRIRQIGLYLLGMGARHDYSD